MKQTRGLLASVALLGLGFSFESASATYIPNAIQTATATAYQQGDAATGNGSVSQVVNGAGLTVGSSSTPSTWTQDNLWQDGWQGQTTVTTTSPGWFIINLGSVFTNLQSMYIWNVTESGQTARGTSQADVFYATSPTVAVPATPGSGTTNYSFGSGGWTPLAAGIQIAQATGSGTDPFDYLQSLSGITGGAQYIGIQMDTNWGGGGATLGGPTRSGFSEIEVTTAPEPASISLAALTVGGLLLRRRRTLA